MGRRKRKQVEDTNCAPWEYEFTNGRRLVAPYDYDFTVSVKRRWIGMKLIEIFRSEFPYYPQEYLADSIRVGRISYNGETKSPEFVVKDGGRIVHRTHRHEPPVFDAPIELLDERNELVLIDKPPSLPVHPCGRFSRNSVTEIIRKEFGKLVFPIHRLDRLTSGLLLVATSKEAATKYGELLRDRQVSKRYVARVTGVFPKEQVRVDEPIEILDYKKGLYQCSPSGKEASTVFTRLFVDEEAQESVVQCDPKTGRTHQIRLHLKHLGFPIANDPLYGPNAKDSTITNTPAASKEEPSLESTGRDTTAGVGGEGVHQSNNASPGGGELSEGGGGLKKRKVEVECDEPLSSDSTDVVARICPYCKGEWSAEEPEMFIYLHAYQYSGLPNMEDFKVPLPAWAQPHPST